MAKQKDLSDFMAKKNAESRGVYIEDSDDEEEKLKDAPKTIHKEAGVDDSRSAKALATFRYIMRMLFIIPMVLAVIVLVAYVLIKLLPAAMYFIRKLIVSIASLQ